MQECASKYGRIFKLDFGVIQPVMIVHPEDVKYVLTHPDIYVKRIMLAKPLKETGSESLAFVNNPAWKRQRSAFDPAFHKTNLINAVGTFIECTQMVLDILDQKEGKSQEMTELMTRFTIDVLGKAVFSFDFGQLKGSSNSEINAYKTFVGACLDPLSILILWSEKIPSAYTKGVYEAMRVLKRLFGEVVASKKLTNSSVKRDLLDMFLNSDLSDTEITHNMMIFFIAGQDTTAIALSWMFLLLADNPNQQRILFEEIDRELQGRTPTYQDLEKLPYLDMVIKEGARLFPPAATVPTRVSSQADQIGKITIPKGAPVWFSIYHLHRNPEFWPEPEKFIPERFSKENAEKIQPYSYMPFSKGPRSCIGSKFSVIEQKIFIIMLLQRFTVEGPTSYKTPLNATLFKPGELFAVVKKRS